MADFAQLLIVSAVVMGISHTIAKERIFARLRARMGGKETWSGYLVSCPYCVSHWVAFVVVPLTGTYVVPVAPWLGLLGPVLQWFLSSILVTVLAAFLRVGFYMVDEAQGLVRRRQRTEEEEASHLHLENLRAVEREHLEDLRAAERQHLETLRATEPERERDRPPDGPH